jgi:hypothetical protein
VTETYAEKALSAGKQSKRKSAFFFLTAKSAFFFLLCLPVSRQAKQKV